MNIPEWAVRAVEEMTHKPSDHPPQKKLVATLDCIYEDYQDAVNKLIALDHRVRNLVADATHAQMLYEELAQREGSQADRDAAADLLHALEPFTSSPAVLNAVTPQSGPSTHPRAGSAVVDAPPHLRITEVE